MDEFSKKLWFRKNLLYYSNNIEESELQLFPFLENVKIKRFDKALKMLVRMMELV
jgi:hypothetical protein